MLESVKVSSMVWFEDLNSLVCLTHSTHEFDRQRR